MKSRMNKRLILIALAILFFTLLFVYVLWLRVEMPNQGQTTYKVVDAFPALAFTQPVGIYHAGDGSNRLFVLEQQGTIRIFQNAENIGRAEVFLDISDHVLFSGEQGLLGLAFHPNYSENGYFYVNYVADNPRRTVIARYSTTVDDPNQADRNSELVLFEINQPFTNHKGGQMAFGADKYLYIALGDGGSAGDPLGNAQNRSSLLGKILRIDVDASSGGKNYGTPVDNPYSSNTMGYREEIYAYGLRNPWRFSFDATTQWLWVSDAGQSRREEIDLVKKGGNYGWNIMEGSLCYSPQTDCNTTGLELPVWEYSRDEGVAVIGGFVYHGSKLMELRDSYIYGDYGSGKIWALTYDNSSTVTNRLLVDSSLIISSFGLDQQNEMYICAFDGKIHTLAISGQG